jgi:peptidoglycan/LPS O-acetylase OafA/YrhL
LGKDNPIVKHITGEKVSFILADRAHGRDNNFNLIRFLAATLVILSHSYSLTGLDDPLQKYGETLGLLAVDVFFITSGFLVTGSLFQRKSVISFVTARILRIYPALIAAVLFCVFVIGTAYTRLPISLYFSDNGIYRFLFHNMTLLGKLEFNLPGVFENNPLKNAVNGSLWTLPVEVRLYASLTILSGFFYIKKIKQSERFIKYAILSCCAISTALFIYYYEFSCYTYGTLRCVSMFFIGAACWVLRHRIIISHTISLFLLALPPLFLWDIKVFFILLHLVTWYFVLYAAYAPDSFIRRFNLFGDYSYGLYIYAMPIQQSLAQSYSGINNVKMFLFSFLLTLFLAVISWHLIERPMLQKKTNLSLLIETNITKLIKSL